MSPWEAADRARDAAAHAVVYGQDPSLVKRAAATLAVSLSFFGLGVLASVWHVAERALGPVAMRPLHDLSRDLWGRVVGDPELKLVKDDDGDGGHDPELFV